MNTPAPLSSGEWLMKPSSLENAMLPSKDLSKYTNEVKCIQVLLTVKVVHTNVYGSLLCYILCFLLDFCAFIAVFVKDEKLEGKISAAQVKRKWENLKQKYKDLNCPQTGVSTEDGEVTAASWKWYALLDEAIGGRPSITPPNLIASSGPGVAVTSPSSERSTFARTGRKRKDIEELIREMEEKEEREIEAVEREERRWREMMEREERRERERREQEERREREAREREERRDREMREREERRDRETKEREERFLQLLELFAKKN
ncbi:Stress response protein nst1 [Anabarilius grahami]|uniref:Stress response protein nst1 n=1 Tax=Anabarilius grahami TaxID=495550 RepID=A0A3N0ZA65_ANAGA|nr:Stress response protein nst1 [Anabarilius grahami]